MSSSPKLLSVQAGRRQSFQDSDSGRKWESAIVKNTVTGSVKVNELGIEGDEQVDPINHGGIDKAILAYAADHFEWWKQEYKSAVVSPSIGGAFGENLSIAFQSEKDICVGDIWRFGNCTLQVSQPRQPCWKLSRRWNLPDLSNRVQKSGRTGWYLRVVETGELKAGDGISLLERQFPQWTIKNANEVMYVERSAERDRELAACPLLSQAWKDQLLERVAKRESKG